ncbi:GntR family transcriptional regulator [Rhodospirillaceae bacterium KN72]|uniref:GntR family transcriptional regulator n=1 Tax=Pacificispira spongiicola TaxID=2729598 RepID=A0A7Y0DXS9_9PROT|nr:GntR family transcriptional regulator [Pacificispira spongiicola]NMM43577.1 GntR family transcriptional regulator [Pacificispira spongiicola]
MPVRPLADHQPIDHPSPQVAEIVSRLREEIISGDLAPGEALGQEHLASRFGVSRMPVREAIRHLESLGFVTVESNKRARVAAVSADDFLDIFDMRVAAETLAIRRAIPELTNARIDAAEAIQKQIESAPLGGFGDLNMRLHMTLYEACGRPRLLAHILMLGNAADRYLCMVKAGPTYREKSDREHYELLSACRARDADAAADVTARHIGEARDALVDYLREIPGSES